MLQYQFIKAYLTSKAKTERGASLVEYALLVGLRDARLSPIPP